jgi:hypothetical protein
MAYVLLIAAVITSVLVAAACYALKWRRVVIIAPLQFVASLGVTYFLGPTLSRDRLADDALLIALAISAAVPGLFVVLFLFFGRLDRREPGPIGKKVAEHDAKKRGRAAPPGKSARDAAIRH